MSALRELVVALSALGSLAITNIAGAQSTPAFPTKPVRFITVGAAGGGTDLTSRAIAHSLSQAWGQQVIVDNRPGGSGVVAYDNFVKANPDGHTLLMMTASHTINPSAIAQWPHDLLGIISPVSQVTSLYYIVYHHPAAPISSFKEMIEYGRKYPNKLHFGTGGNAGLAHLGWEILMQASGAKFKHVTYKGAAPAIAATITGEMHLGFASLLSLRPHIVAGRARALAITSRKRSPAIPELPTVAELGIPGYEIDQWYGLVTNAKAPAAAINRLHASVIEAIKSPELVQRLTLDGSTPVGTTPAQFGAHIKSEVGKWRKVLSEAGLLAPGLKP